MTTHVGRIAASDMDGWVRQLGIGFHFDVVDGFAAHLLEHVDLERTWAAYDGDLVVGTLRSFGTELTVPGQRTVPAAALTNVTVAPSHRRRGLLTEMITADLRASKEREEAVGILVASEWPIYGRFGYGPAITGARYEIDASALEWRFPTEGTVKIVERPVMRQEAPAIYDAWRQRTPGAIVRKDYWWDRALRIIDVPGDEPAKERNVLYRAPSGDTEGYARYEAKQEWESMRPKGRLTLLDLVALTPRAERRLWEYLCDVDLVATVEAGDRPVDDPVVLLAVDGRHVKTTGVHDFIWVRILDVAQSLGSRSYGNDGSVVFEIVDDLALAGGRFRLESGPDGAACKPTTEAADLTLPVDTLGAAYMGGCSFARLQAGGRLEENSEGAVAKADSMFLTGRAPFCSTWF
jgi:predicted acetyltransferase